MINKENWKENYTHISNEVIDNEKVLRVVKSGKINEYDENTYAKLVDSSFHNGIIDIHQILLTNGINNDLPMVRWY